MKCTAKFQQLLELRWYIKRLYRGFVGRIRLFTKYATENGHALIVLFGWNNSSYTSTRILNIAFVARYNMHMNMKNALTSSLAHIHPQIKAIRMILHINNSFNAICDLKHIHFFFSRKVKERRNMPFRYNKRVAKRYRKTVKECKRQ